MNFEKFRQLLLPISEDFKQLLDRDHKQFDAENEAYFQDLKRECISASMSEIIMLNKHQIEARREYLKDVRYVEMQLFEAKRPNASNIEKDDLVHFPNEFVDFLKTYQLPFRNIHQIKGFESFIKFIEDKFGIMLRESIDEV